jgi:hypothetical protein
VTTFAAADPAGQTAGHPRASADPFVVTGTHRGRAQSVTVPDVPGVLAVIGRWTADDPAATGSWALRGDYSAPVSLVARLRPGLIGERGRVAHVFSLVPGVPQRCTLTTCCGAQLSILQLEWLELGQGMPCEPCLHTAARTLPTTTPATPPLPTARPRPLSSALPRLAW